jgi:hypothetical protein
MINAEDREQRRFFSVAVSFLSQLNSESKTYLISLPGSGAEQKTEELCEGSA